MSEFGRHNSGDSGGRDRGRDKPRGDGPRRGAGGRGGQSGGAGGERQRGGRGEERRGQGSGGRSQGRPNRQQNPRDERRPDRQDGARRGPAGADRQQGGERRDNPADRRGTAPRGRQGAPRDRRDGTTEDDTRRTGDRLSGGSRDDKRPAGKHSTGASQGGKPWGDKPRGDKPRGDKPGGGKPGPDKPGRDKPGGDKPWRSKPGAHTEHTPGEDNAADAPADNRPELPEGAEFAALDAEARRELRSLPKNLAELIGHHLAAAGMLIDEDPERALVHARYARERAARVPLVREAAGLSAYHAGEWAEAISELRAVRRMSGSQTHVAILADCERALGRPERAIELARETDLSTLAPETAAELKIVAAGARRDMGELDAAVVSLQGKDLDPQVRHPWSARLFYAYADNLLAVGRADEAVQWFMHAADADEDGETDAAERAMELGDAGRE